MAIVTIDPDSGKFPEIRRGGKYGPSCPNPAECTIAGYVHPSDANDENTPAWVFEKYGKDGGAHKFVFKIVEPDQTVYHQQYEPAGKNTKSRALAFVKGAGVPTDVNGSFDTEALVGKKVILEFSEPKAGSKDPSRKFVNCIAVYGVGE